MTGRSMEQIRADLAALDCDCVWKDPHGYDCLVPHAEAALIAAVPGLLDRLETAETGCRDMEEQDQRNLAEMARMGAENERLRAKWWTRMMGRIDEPHPADWEAPCRETCKPGHRRQQENGIDYCPAAGVYRNQEMVDSGLDILLVFPGGRGTADMVDRAKRASIPIRDLREGAN